MKQDIKPPKEWLIAKYPSLERDWMKHTGDDLWAAQQMLDYAKDILTSYTHFLLKEGYVDSDVYDEPPTPIDQFCVKNKLW